MRPSEFACAQAFDFFLSWAFCFFDLFRFTLPASAASTPTGLITGVKAPRTSEPNASPLSNCSLSTLIARGTSGPVIPLALRMSLMAASSLSARGKPPYHADNTSDCTRAAYVDASAFALYPHRRPLDDLRPTLFVPLTEKKKLLVAIKAT